MTKDDIIQMALESNLLDSRDHIDNPAFAEIIASLEEFAKLVAAHEQLRCADLVTDMGNKGWDCFSASAALLIRSQS